MKALHSIPVIMAAVVSLAFSVSVHASETDSRIESSARQSYVFRTYLQVDDIKIRSSDGDVTLTGVVSENFHKSLAQETVAGLPGVRRVDNKLAIKGAAPTANSDAWLRDKVKVALLFHASVSAATTEVTVKDGIVTVRGIAATQAQKELTTEYAKDVDGVKDVKNEMSVSMTSKNAPRTIGEKIDDASISAQVNMTLLNHRSTSAINTTVKTERGIVTVGGKAGTTDEKNQVTRLVSDINGVASVTNSMTIEK